MAVPQGEFAVKTLHNVRKTPKPARDAYHEEFPFLNTIWQDWLKKVQVWHQEVWYVGVERLDLEVLEIVPTDPSWDSWATPTAVYLVGNNNEVLGRVSANRKEPKLTSNDLQLLWPPNWFKKRVPGDSVKQALMDLGVTLGKLKYVVVVSCWVTHIQIFKLPVNFSLGQFIEAEKQKLREAIQKG